MKMKFKNYCVVIMGNTSGVIKEIEKISDSKPNILKATGIIIATFTTFVDVKEITAWFTLNDRNFLVFDLDDNYSGYYISKKDIHEGLFGFLNKTTNSELDSKTLDFFKSITVNSVDVTIKPEEPKITNNEINKMTLIEKQELMDKIIEKGVENLTEHEKKILPLLAK